MTWGAKKAVPEPRRSEILALLDLQPHSIGELMKTIPLERETIRAYLKVLENEHECHISGATKARRTGAREKVFSRGPAPADAPKDMTAAARIIDYVRKNPKQSTAMIAAGLGVTQRHVARTVFLWRKGQHGATHLHISGWEVDEKRRNPMYSVGSRPDKPRPGPHRNEVLRKVRAKLRADKVAHELFLAKDRARKRANRAAKVGATDLLSLAWMGKLALHTKQEAA